MTVVVNGHDLVASHDCAIPKNAPRAVNPDGSALDDRRRLARQLKEEGLTHQEIANRLGVSKGTVLADVRSRTVTPHTTRNGTTPEERRELARRLREQGLSQAAIAEQLGVSPSTVSNDLNGRRDRENGSAPVDAGSYEVRGRKWTGRANSHLAAAAAF